MTQEYKKIKLKDACAVFADGDWIERKDQSIEGIRLVQTGNIGFGFFKDKKDKSRFISEETFKRLNCTEIIPGDLLVSRLPDPVGKSCIIPEINSKMITGVDCTIIRPKDNLSSEFLGYYQMSNQYLKDVQANVSGATRQRISRKKLGLIEIPLPPLPQQKQIVAILDKAFAAIDTAKANAEQNLLNAKELFESYLQNIFENKGDDWEEKTISEIVENGILAKPLDGNHGETHPVKSDFKESGVPFIMSKDLAEGLVNQKTCHFISREQADLLRKGFSIDGDVLLTHKGTIGRVAILKTDLDYVMLTPQVTYYRVLNKEVLYNRYLFYYLKSPIFQKPMNKIAGIGSTRAYIGITKQRELKIRFPNNLNLQKEIVQKLDSLSAETKKLEVIYALKIADLEEMKKSILQKAFSGQLTTTN